MKRNRSLVIGIIILSCVIINLCRLLSPSKSSLPPQTVIPETEVPTVDPSYLVEYQVELDENALCTSDAVALKNLEKFGIPIRYIDYSSGKSDLQYVNKLGIGLPPSAFPWSYKFTLRKSATKFADRLFVEGEAPVITDYSCHVLTCKIILNGVEMKSKTSIIEDRRGNKRATKLAGCDMWISDIDW